MAGAGAWTLYGLGPAPAPHGRLRAVVRRALKEAARKARRITVVFDEGVSVAALSALLPQIATADYAFERYKSRRPKDAPRRHVAVDIVTPPGIEPAALAGAAARAHAVADAVVWARDLGNTPGNDLGPGELAREAGALAKRHGLRFRVLDKRAIERERMGGLLGVNAGSARPPVFLIGDYAPKAARGTAVLVGKGITFDTGGISIKPAAGDGGDEVRHGGRGRRHRRHGGHRRSSKPRINVVGARARHREHARRRRARGPATCCALRNGKTIEVVNTDAEGRLILADALSYAATLRARRHRRRRHPHRRHRSSPSGAECAGR